MAKKIIKIFMLTTIIVMLLIIGLLTVYIIGFKDKADKGRDKLSDIPKKTKLEKNSILNEALPDAGKEEVVRGIIFIGDREDKTIINSAYFVNLDIQESKISFYNFPGDMMFEVSNELHKEISTSLADIPQVLKLSHLYKYSKNRQGLKAGMLMLEDYLDLGLSHYLFLDAEDAEKIFYFNEKGESTFLQSFVNNIINGSNEKKAEFVASVYNDRLTDIKKKIYVKLLTKIEDIKPENIKFTTIQGEKLDNGVVIKKEDLSQVLSLGSE